GLRASRVALAAGPAIELAINPPRFVTFRSQHVKTAGLRDTCAEFDVGPASRHVRGDGEPAGLAGARDDLRLLAVPRRVEKVERQPSGSQFARQHFARLHRARANQHGLPGSMSTLDFHN